MTKLDKLLSNDWAKNALSKQSQIVIDSMTPGKIMDADQILTAVNAKGFDWEDSHVLGSLRFLKSTQRVEQKQGGGWLRPQPKP